MESGLYFFIIFLVTILITRLFLYLKSIPAPTIKGFRVHHYLYGLVLIPIGALLGNVTIYAIGLGLFIDELGFLVIGGKTHKDNYSWKSLSLLAIFIISVFILKKQFLFWI